MVIMKSVNIKDLCLIIKIMKIEETFPLRKLTKEVIIDKIQNLEAIFSRYKQKSSIIILISMLCGYQ